MNGKVGAKLLHDNIHSDHAPILVLDTVSFGHRMRTLETSMTCMNCEVLLSRTLSKSKPRRNFLFTRTFTTANNREFKEVTCVDYCDMFSAIEHLSCLVAVVSANH